MRHVILLPHREPITILILIVSRRRISASKRWFDYASGPDRLDPVSSWHRLVTQYFDGDLKPPFNIAERHAAKFSSAFYGPLAERDDLIAPTR